MGAAATWFTVHTAIAMADSKPRAAAKKPARRPAAKKAAPRVQPETKKPWWKSWTIGRDTVLFAVGLFGILHETLFVKVQRPELLILFGAMVGLPAFLRSDELRSKD